MKTKLALIFLGCLALASCEKPQIITPATTGINNVSSLDSTKAVNNDGIIPPTLPSTGGWPK